MARKPSPWYWPERQRLVHHPSRATALSSPTTPLDAPSPQKRNGQVGRPPPTIMQAFHALLAKPPEEEPAPQSRPRSRSRPSPRSSTSSWAGARSTVPPRPTSGTATTSKISSIALVTPPRSAVCRALRPFHVIEWVDSHRGLVARLPPGGHRRGAAAVQLGRGDWATSPPTRSRRSPSRSRSGARTPSRRRTSPRCWPRSRRATPSATCCCSPGTPAVGRRKPRHIEPRHVHLEAECIVIPKDEAKGKKRPRVILLQGVALEIVRRLLAARSRGQAVPERQGPPLEEIRHSATASTGSCCPSAWTNSARQGVTVPPLPRFNRRAYADKASLAPPRKEHQRKLRERRKQIYWPSPVSTGRIRRL